MNKGVPPQAELMESKGCEDTPSSEKQHKKIRTSPPEDEDSPRLLDKHSSTTSTSASTATNSPISISPRASTTTNNNNNNNNNNTRHDKDITTEENLYHKRATKQGKHKIKKDHQHPSWGTRLRTHPKPVVRFGTNNGSPHKVKGEGESDEEGEEDADEHAADLPHERPPSPPSSPHPPDDVPLETLLKHGSGWVRKTFK